jgi:peptidoglycan/xylan/chitin deacetylase (PgdA/CDA1 family)
MTYSIGIGGKRELIARGLLWSGALWLAARLPARDSLLVLTYHRIGNPDEDLFDPGAFSATGDQFNDQISYLKRRGLLVTLEEALAFVDGRLKERVRRCRVLITFDDGYRDNYEIAFPILRSHGAQGVFFLVTGMIGSTKVPWWDHIAYLMKTGRSRRFSLHYPADLAVDIVKDGLEDSLRAVLKLYKRPENLDAARFMEDLAEQTRGDNLPGTMRRFLNAGEAREMVAEGMAIGSHTHSHQVLNQLAADRQAEELTRSRSILKEQLGIATDVLAYPVGAKLSFSIETQRIARESGYRAAFSHHGGRNMPGKTCAYDIKRNKVGSQSWNRFRVQSAVCSLTGSYWP